LTSQLILRTFTESDTDSVIAMWASCGLLRPWNDPRRDLRRKFDDSPWGLVVGATRDRPGELVSVMMVGYDGHRGSVYYLAVAPEHQGRGFGSEMMDHAEEMLRARGCPKINLFVRADNAGVIGFYTARGYQVYTAVELATLGLRLLQD
jgi:ribosomal protein S18 acetylase RimI-like enzyme